LSGHFITIDNENKVGEWQMMSQTVFSTNRLTICCLITYFQSYGYKRNYLPFAFIDKDGEIIDKIKGDKWTIIKLGFLASGENGNPTPEVSFKLNDDKDIILKHSSFNIRSMQQIWDFFLKLNENCTTLLEAKFYQEYFIESINNRTMSKTIEDYKREIEQKNIVINQYESLLKKIELMVEKVSVTD
jgi:hypothetical protein